MAAVVAIIVIIEKARGEAEPWHVRVRPQEDMPSQGSPTQARQGQS